MSPTSVPTTTPAAGDELSATESLESAARATLQGTESAGGRTLRVLDSSTEKPVAGAQIVSQLHTPSLIAVTDESGIAQLSAVGRDEELEITARDYFPVAISAAQVAESTGSSHEVRLNRAGRLVVSVVDETQSRVSGVRITVYPSDPIRKNVILPPPRIWPRFGNRPGRAATLHDIGVYGTTDPQGEMVVDPLPCDVPLAVTAYGPVPETIVATMIPGTERQAEVLVQVRSSGVVSGKLVWDDGAPASHLNVRFLVPEKGSAPPPVVLSQTDGAFQAVGIPVGAFGWQVEYAGELPRAATLGGKSLDLGTITLPAPSKLAGHVILQQPPEGFGYCAIRGQVLSRGRLYESFSCEVDGSFAVNVPAGEYDLAFQVTSSVLKRTAAFAPSADLVVDLSTSVATLQVQCSSVVPGSAVVLSLTPVRAVSYDTELVRSFSHSTTDLCPLLHWTGERLSLFCQRPGRYQVTLSYGDAITVSAGAVDLTAGSISLVECPPAANSSLEVRVRDSTGNAVSDVPIEASFVATDFLRQLQRIAQGVSDSKGACLFQSMISGDWIVYPRSLGRNGPQAQLIEVAAGHSNRIELVVEGMGALAGSVTRGGISVGDVPITLRPMHEGFGERALVRTRSGADGLFQFDTLAGGWYSVTASWRDPDNLSARCFQQQAIEVRAHSTASASFQLDAARTRLLFSRGGAPLSDLRGGLAYSSSGVTNIMRLSTGVGEALAALGGSPWLFLVSTYSQSETQSPKRGGGVYAAFIAHSSRAESDLVRVELTGTDLVIRLEESGTLSFPSVTLERVGPFFPLLEGHIHPGLAYVDDAPLRRRYVAIPPSATVLLKGDDEQTMKMSTNGQAVIEVNWPPPK